MTNTSLLLERYLHRTLRLATGDGPPRLLAAMHHAVFPGGSRLRPQLCLAVAQACGASCVPAAIVAASAIELLHCASLTHDDMPCFDNASTRRGRPSVHRAFGERLALLAGDALIVLAFQAVVRERHASADQRLRILSRITEATGSSSGIAAGQAWECEPQVTLSHYQQCKTGALFVAATTTGAIAADADADAWIRLGECIGEAYQIADDICDVMASPEVIGKPTGRDAALGRPNCVSAYGMAKTQSRLRGLVDEAVAAIPRCPGADELSALLIKATENLLAARLARPAA